ncbi:hypothetical protein VL04_00655 [Chromobacterium violaceum]|nr:hypothetical protein VK93_19335 [Chromobacterium violaceum]KMN86570.1 hypothetical protein VL02_07550 [Chromobacterium violaceum]KMN92061.1 hypothetical protein VL04_00655 [Chromobacterium violaceum]KMO04196.1 hypothetical protein VL16_10175 [Chromobacterium violaceum]
MGMVIDNEEEAFVVLKQALEGRFEGQVIVPEFHNWPVITFRYSGERYHGTLTPSMMKGLIEIQEGLNRTFASLVYEHNDARHLRDDERSSIEYTAKVEEGSSLVTIDLSTMATQLVNQMAAKMTGTELVIVALAGMAVWGAKAAYSKYLDTKTRQRELDIQHKMSANMVENTRILTEAITRDQRLPAILSLADNARHTLIRGATTADAVELNGEALDHGTVMSLAQARRERARSVQLNGNYYIRMVDTSHPDMVKLKVESVLNGQLFSATFMDETLEHRHIELLQRAEWNREKVFLAINGSELRGQVTSAEVLSVAEAQADIA